MTDYLWLIPALPLLGFLLNGLLGQYLGRWFVSLVGPGVIGLSFILSVLAFLEMLHAPGLSLRLELFTWIESGSFSVPIAFVVDRLSGLYIVFVTGVAFLIHIYSVGYMGDEEDYGFWRFFAYLNLFVFFMLMLVLGSSYLLLFVGWEGVGLCSYLLIGYYYKKPSAATAAKKAFVVNRIGDFGFIVASILIFLNFGTLDFAAVNESAAGTLAAGGGLATAICLLLFLGATGKSAQIPLYVWLPDAMEGPTPVSALIHAATMVTAGLYLIARNSHLFVLSPDAMAVVAVVGCATAFFAATIGMAQYDIKRVLAYSTVSQLGYMFMAMGVGAWMAAIFHVMTHAFFKALLFLGSGSVIHANHHEQDMRRYGGLLKAMPITGWTYIIGSFAISGFPLIFAGFFSKDEILWRSYASPFGHPLLWVVGVITAVMTAFYMFRSVALTFFGESRQGADIPGEAPAHGHDDHGDHGHGHGKHAVHESPWTMTLPLVVLAFLSIVAGWIGIPHALGHDVIPNVLEHYFDGFFAELPVADGHHSVAQELLMMTVSTLLALGAMFAAYRLFSGNLALAASLKARLTALHTLLNRKYYIDELYEGLIVKPTYFISKDLLWRVADAGIIDGIVNGVAATARNVGGALRLSQTGVAQNYAVGIVIGAAAIFWYLVFRG